MRVRKVVEEAFDVGFDDPLRLPVGNDLRDPPQRIVRTTPGTKAVREVAKLRLPDGLQDAAQAVLDQAILETRNPQGAIAAIPFGDISPPYRLRDVAEPAQLRRQVVQPLRQSLCIIVFSYPIDSGRLGSVLTLEAFTQPLGIG